MNREDFTYTSGTMGTIGGILNETDNNLDDNFDKHGIFQISLKLVHVADIPR